MEELEQLIRGAREGDLVAFGAVVRRFQDSARAAARTAIGDADLAEDIVQEAFVQAYRDIAKLRDPAAFPGWFRSILSHCISRFTRGKRIATVPLDHAAELPSGEPSPEQSFERKEMQEKVLEAVRSLPDHERVVTQLYYLDGCSQSDIATRLAVPVTTVNSRLHASRRRLREQIAEYSPVERMSRSKERRHWLPSRLSKHPELVEGETEMALGYEKMRRRLPAGDKELLIRVMTREDIPAMRRLDDEINAELDAWNTYRPPGAESVPGGPWSTDEWLTEHFEKFERTGNITLLAEEEATGRLVAFADLWAGHEPEPFGSSIDAECIDYLREYYHLGIEIALLEEAEKVARAAGVGALDIGTGTSSGDYPSLRRLGMQVFYECDFVTCRCRPVAPDWKLDYQIVPVKDLDLSNVVTVAHWAPSDFTHMSDAERVWIAEFTVQGHRAVLELYGPPDESLNICLPVPQYVPVDSTLFVAPRALTSARAMSAILRECALLAGANGAETMKLSCPSDMELDSAMVEVVSREFGYAWMRKKL